MRTLVPALGLALVVTTAPACAAEDRPAPAPDPDPASSSSSSAPESEPSDGGSATPERERTPASAPRLRVRTVVDGLDNPWDVKRLPGGTLLVTERDNRRLSTVTAGERSTVEFDSSSIWVSGETGLMSLEVDPDFADNRTFYTCSGWEKAGGGHDVRVIAWELAEDEASATRLRTVVKGFPTSSGRHGGCRLLIARNGAMHVGTGDAAIGTNPRNLKSLGGKTLRLDPDTGKPWPNNPFAQAKNRKKRLVFTYGHRNVQGLAQRRDGSVWSVEHGSYRDDEVNLLRRGGDYGWNPTTDGGPGYDESVPMTDQSLPGRQLPARWRSGDPTIATSGAAWVYGKKWGRYAGTLAVAALKAERVVFMKFDSRGRLKWTRAPKALRGLDRLRSVTQLPDRDLLLTTDNDGGGRILRVTAR
ncbi:PQQ-dependent sugar dehydrogenase [Nocardioides aestuarii]|uniref:PQQ-dependent sugar dehydrogenase n=1 Tax=Nocardioides aestuarii TaxID=252231 RepID=A0ABW4TV57_9ACTN